MTSRPETSPFTPGQPVPLELFVGREGQIESLLEHAGEARAGHLKVGFLTGDRGIGKTSLARFAAHLAQEKHGLLGLHVVLGGVTDAGEMVRRIFDQLANVARRRRLWGRIGSLFGERIRSVGLFGLEVEFHPEQRDLELLTERFDRALRSVLQKLEGTERKGLFIVLDDINGLAASPSFATWLKNFVDTVAVTGHPFPVFLLFVGPEGMRRMLASHNESVARIFIPFEVKGWSPGETSDFYRKAFRRTGMTLEDSACTLMTEFAGGIPVLAHEIGDAAFRFAPGLEILHEDGQKAVIRAARIVGHKYLSPKVFDRIRSPRYRSLLRTIPKAAPAGHFKRSRILPLLSTEERASLDSFLRVMRKFEVLERDLERGPGHYRFTSNLHFLYLLLKAGGLS